MWNNPLTISLITTIVPSVNVGLFTGVIFPLLLERFSKKREPKILLPPGIQDKIDRGEIERIKKRIKWIATVSAIVAGVIAFLIFRPTIYSYYDRPSGEVIEEPVTTSTPTIVADVTVDVNEPTPIAEPTNETIEFVPTPKPTMVSLSRLSQQKRDDFSSQETGWDDYYFPDGLTGYEDSKYFIELDERILFLSVWGGGGRYRDGVFQTEILGPLSLNGIIRQGIGVGWETGWTNKVYAVTVNFTGQCHFYENIDKTLWRSVFSSEVQNFDASLDRHVLTLVIDENNKASVYVDGSFCADYTLHDYEGGKVGVVALGSNDGGKAYFDNYQIFTAP